MKTKAYHEWLQGLEQLTRNQRIAVFIHLNVDASATALADELERNQRNACPHYQNDRLGR